MKKSIFAALIFFSFDAFSTDTISYSCGSYTKFKYDGTLGPEQWSNAGGLTPNTWTHSCQVGTYATLLKFNYITEPGYIYKGVQYSGVSSCPSGTVEESSGICHNSCAIGEVFKPETGCAKPDLSSFDNDPQGCSNAGGVYYMSHTKQVGGTTYGAGFFGGSGITLGGDVQSVNKCGTYADAIGTVASNLLAFAPFLSKFMKTSAIQNAASRALSTYLNNRYGSGTFTSSPFNVDFGLPKITSSTSGGSSSSSPTVYNSPSGSGGVSFPISESSIPTSTNSSGVTGVSEAPQLTIDEAYQKFLNDVYFPSAKTSGTDSTLVGDSTFNYSTIDRFNTISDLTHEPKLSDLVPSTSTSQKPVLESIDLSKYYPNNYTSPSVVATVQGSTSKTLTYSGNDPVDNYLTTYNYIDGTLTQQSVTINRTTKNGTITETTISKSGDSSTLTYPIYVPQYVGYVDNSIVYPPTNYSFPDPENNPIPSSNPTPDPAVSPNPDPTVTIVIDPTATNPLNPTNPSPVTNPDTVSNQDSSTIINAVMPSYSLPGLSDFVPFDSNPITDMVNGASSLFDNIRQSIDDTKLVFNQTKTLLEGKWQAPVIPSGSCGNFMSFDFHGRHVDLCTPMAQATSEFSPVISSIFSVAGISVAVGIFIGGF